METTIMGSMGGCQNYGPFLGTLNIRGRIIIGTQKGTIILTTTQVIVRVFLISFACHGGTIPLQPVPHKGTLLNESYYSILGLYWDNGKENGGYYSILGLYWDNGKENGGLGFRV